MHFADRVELMGLIHDINESFDDMYKKLQRSIVQAEEKRKSYDTDPDSRASELYKTKAELLQALTTIKFELAKRHQNLFDTLEKEFGHLNRD